MYYYINSTKDIYSYNDFESQIEEKDEEKEEIKEKTIIVHVTGAVQNEGIVEVKENARINDVIQSAGGLREDAELSNVNLAYVVEDGQKIYIPSKEDIEDIAKQPNTENTVINGNNYSEQNGLININTANQEKLQNIPGIGESTALKIITYRNENRKI